MSISNRKFCTKSLYLTEKSNRNVNAKCLYLTEKSYTQILSLIEISKRNSISNRKVYTEKTTI